MNSLFRGLERIEEARERLTGASFMAGLYEGRPNFDLLLLPPEPPEDREAGEAFCRALQEYLIREVDPDEIERTAKIPARVLEGLFRLGAFAMKIPKEYGGLGLSYTNYGRALTLMASWSNILALTVAVPQSIGIAMPILLFGNDAQKKRYLPEVAREAVSAFALTEPATGSDAANVHSVAVLNEAGTHYVVNGEKLWCTNGSIARYVTLIAKVPAVRVRRDGSVTWVPVQAEQQAQDHVHTAFILDMRTSGVQVRQRCQFEGCRGIENAHITLRDVRIPVEQVIGEVGKGLKYALTILNVGRGISIPAICLGMARQAWQPTLDRAMTRLTFQRPLAERQTQQIRLGQMAIGLFAMEALATLVWRMTDTHHYDIRIEAAIAKVFCSEHTIRFMRDSQILFGGMGYETADSKRLRGEPGFGIEQLVRDAEMYRIGEGATDILRPFIVREGLSRHIERVQRYTDGSMSRYERGVELWRLVRRYLPWYGAQYRRRALPPSAECLEGEVRQVLSYVERTSRRLARRTFGTLLRHREGFREEQYVQSLIELIGEDLLAMASVALHAESAGGRELADSFCAGARLRIEENFRRLRRPHERSLARVGAHAVDGRYGFLSNGSIKRGLCDYGPTVAAHDAGSSRPNSLPEHIALGR